ncbi:MAG: hypothetical protein HZB71_10205 [Betaproteobacteria bacterium]|nr:hypothetical protein [Betaproteobacteria bacterium]
MRTPVELRVGAYYSNGSYGRSWGVREVMEFGLDPESGQETVVFRGLAGACRRKQGDCTAAEFLAWARYEVALNENSWQRVGYFEEEWPEVEE